MSGTWTTIDADAGIHVSSYLFAGNPINTVALELGEGRVLVVGPSIDPRDQTFAELDAIGEVVAIASPGPFHHLGFPAWTARYPDATLFAPGSGPTRIPKQHKRLDLRFQPITALASLLPSHMRVTETPAKHADIHLIVEGEGDQRTWITCELISNAPEYPPQRIVRFLFKMTGTHPGLAVNRLVLKFIGAKKSELGAFFRTQLDENPPSRLVPSHGDVLEAPDLPQRIRGIVDTAF